MFLMIICIFLYQNKNTGKGRLLLKKVANLAKNLIYIHWFSLL